jgi:eukaryotic-like serine/threonine-protein kinase
MPKETETLLQVFDASTSSSTLDATVVWQLDDVLAACLERALEVVPVKQAAELRALLPSGADSTRRYLIVELIKIDMATFAEQGQLRPIEFYCNELSDVCSIESVPMDLVLEEIQIRIQLGQTPAQEEYVQRFPRFAHLLTNLQRNSEVTSASRALRRPPDLECQTQVDDFRLIQLLGKGAFANVYLAQQVSMQRLVALKVSHGAGDESQSLAQFDHTNIVRVYDQRTLADQRLHLLYMQFHGGGTLADVVQAIRQDEGTAKGKLLLDCVDRSLLKTAQTAPESSVTRNWLSSADWPSVVAWVGMQLAHALHDAHDHGVLHRDVKPANVLLNAEGIPKLADFNVSFAGAAGRAGAAASFGGSIGYMSPEHLRAIDSQSDLDERVGERADLYSLAVLLWELWQGYRPFQTNKHVASWTEAVHDQLSSRTQALAEPKRSGGAVESVLEETLRSTLVADQNDRPSNGAELASRLRLALFPAAASHFNIKPQSTRAKVFAWSPWLVSILIVLTPNIAGGILNYQYNYHQVMTQDMKEGLEKLSWIVNAFFFPFGAVLIVWLASSIVRAVRASRTNNEVTTKDVDDLLWLGHRSAVIGGSLWLLGGLVIPAGLWLMFPQLTIAQAMHLIVSSLICGGIAMIYPFFGMSVVATWIYYPAIIRRTMRDEHFDRRRQRLIRLSEMYVLIAAILPLLGAAMLLSHQGLSRSFALGGIGAAIAGLLISYFAHRSLVTAWSRMSEILSRNDKVT